LLSATVYKLAKVFVLGDEDRRSSVRSREHVGIGRSRGQLGDPIYLIAPATESVHYLALDALVREVSHSSADGIDHIEAKDVNRVLDRRQHTLPSQRWIGTEYLVDGLAV
jgi:hypothetical protein